MKTLDEILEALDMVGDDQREWCSGMTLEQAWMTCQDADWMEWLAALLGVDMNEWFYRSGSLDTDDSRASAQLMRECIPFATIRAATEKL